MNIEKKRGRERGRERERERERERVRERYLYSLVVGESFIFISLNILRSFSPFYCFRHHITVCSVKKI